MIKLWLKKSFLGLSGLILVFYRSRGLYVLYEVDEVCFAVWFSFDDVFAFEGGEYLADGSFGEVCFEADHVLSDPVVVVAECVDYFLFIF